MVVDRHAAPPAAPSNWTRPSRERALDRRRGRLAEAADRGVAHRLGEVGERGRARRRRSPSGAPGRRAARAAPPGARSRPGTGRTGRTTRRGRTRRSAAGRPARSAVSSNTMTTPEPSVAPAARVALERERHVEARPARRTTPAAPPSRIAWMRAAVRDAARELEQLAQRRRRTATSYTPGSRDVARHAEQLRAGGALGADRRVRRARPSRRISGTLTSVSTLLTAVGLPNRPDLDRERRLVAGLRAAALDRLEQRRLLAHDVRAGADPELDVERPAGARDVVAEEAGRARLRDRVLQRARGRAGTRRGGRGSRARRPTANPSIVIASTSANGSSSRISRSLNVPGSDSSALHTT